MWIEVSRRCRLGRLKGMGGREEEKIETVLPYSLYGEDDEHVPT
jgi:hypothetical protein